LSGKDRYHTRDRKPEGARIIGFGKLWGGFRYVLSLGWF